MSAVPAASRKFERHAGLADCVAAMKVSGNGTVECAYGCLGHGTCVQVCKFDAIFINAYGAAEVNPDKCTHCMQCAKTCPRHVITDIPYAASILVPCASKDKNPLAKSLCTITCIGCRLCEGNCPTVAITVTDNIASIDYTKCTFCGLCSKKCSRNLLSE